MNSSWCQSRCVLEVVCVRCAVCLKACVFTVLYCLWWGLFLLFLADVVVESVRAEARAVAVAGTGRLVFWTGVNLGAVENVAVRSLK